MASTDSGVTALGASEDRSKASAFPRGGDLRSHALELGICLWSQSADWANVLQTARLVDALGYDHLWTWDHLLSIYGEPDQPVFEAWTVLAALAASTTTVRLGPLVCANTIRHPGLVAKIVATLDHVSGGRAILGIGGGWFEREHQAHGIDFGRGFGERLDRLDEAVGLIRALLDGERVTSPGPHYHVRELHHQPSPVQARLPILIGGRGKRRTLRTVAKYGDLWNAYGTPDELKEHNEVLLQHCIEVGRDPATIQRSVQAKVVVRDTEAQATADWTELLQANRCVWVGHGRGSEPDMRDRYVFPDPDSAIWLGSPEQTALRIRGYLDIGFNTVIAEIAAPYDRETIKRLIREVRPMVEESLRGE